VFFNANCNEQVFSPNTEKKGAQIRLVIFKENAKPFGRARSMGKQSQSQRFGYSEKAFHIAYFYILAVFVLIALPKIVSLEAYKLASTKTLRLGYQ